MIREERQGRYIRAKFDCLCRETGKQIKKGETCIYYPYAKAVFCTRSQQALRFREQLVEVAV